MKLFTHLHVHSEYGIFDGCIDIKQLFIKTKRCGMDAVAITDHHNLFNWFHLNEMSNKYQIKALYGCELNIGRNHATVIAVNEKGLQNIIHLNNLGYFKSGRPMVTEKELMDNKEGIFLLSGCSKGKVQSLIFNHRFEEAIEIIREYKSIFKENYALEIQNYKRNNNYKIIKVMTDIAKRKGVKVIPTNDCHFLDKEDFEYHKVLMEVKTNGKLTQINTENYFKTEEEMNELFDEKTLESTKEVKEKAEVNFFEFIRKREGKVKMPISVIFRYNDEESILKVLNLMGKYKLAKEIYYKMKKQDLKLEDLMKEEQVSQEILKMAFAIRGKIKRIEPHKNFFINIDENYPLYRTSKNKPFFVQVEYNEAIKFDLPLYKEIL